MIKIKGDCIKRKFKVKTSGRFGDVLVELQFVVFNILLTEAMKSEKPEETLSHLIDSFNSGLIVCEKDVFSNLESQKTTEKSENFI